MIRIAKLSLLAAVTAAMLASSPAPAQGGEQALANSLRECRRLADADARTACYEGIPLDVPERPVAVEQAPAAKPAPQAAAGFGANQLPAPPSAASSEPDRISARVARVVERQPGIWLITLEDETEWQFVDGAPSGYDPPRPGATVQISRASLGSYLLRYAGQRAVRARRVR